MTGRVHLGRLRMLGVREDSEQDTILYHNIWHTVELSN